MKLTSLALVFLACTAISGVAPAMAGQAPGAASGQDIPVSHRDRVYSAEQFSNTVSVTDPVDNKLVGVIRLGDPQPGNFSPLYKGQVLVHGMGFSPDHKTIAVVSIGSNSVTFIDTATNAVKHTTYVGRSPHEPFFTPDGKEVWVTIRGEDYVAVLDCQSFEEKSRTTANTVTSVPRSIRTPLSLPSPIIGSSATSSRTARSARTSRRHLTASRSGSR